MRSISRLAYSSLNSNESPAVPISVLHPQIVVEDLAGNPLIYYPIPEKAYIEIENGATIVPGTLLAKTPKEVAAASEIVITMVPDTPQVQAVLFGENGVAEGLKKGTLVIDMSSISPIDTKVCKLLKGIHMRPGVIG